MNTHKFMIEDIRFHFNRPDTLIFVGWFYDGSTKNHTLTVELDGQELSVEKLLNRGMGVCQKYIRCVNEISEEVTGIVTLPKNWREKGRLSIRSAYNGKAHRDKVYSVRMLRCLENKIHCCIENVRQTKGKFTVNGWCLGSGDIKLAFFDIRKHPLMAKTDCFSKKDSERVGLEDEKIEKLIFAAQVESDQKKGLCLKISNGKTSEWIRLDKWNNNSRAARIWQKGKKVIHFLKHNGMKATLARISDRLGHDRNAVYSHWLQKYGVTERELEEQRVMQAKFKLRPKFSVAVPLFRTEETFLRELIASLQSQTYDNWELCFADGSEDDGKGLSALVDEYQKHDSRIRYHILEKNYGISRNMNEAMEMAEGDFVALLDHDDTLSPDALFEFAKAINAAPSTEVLYSDEDKTDQTGKNFSEPHFKPDFDLDLLLSNNYICHLFAVKRELLMQTGGFRSEFDGSQDYDFILRCCESAKKVYHVPKVLYHWRCHYDSTAANPQSKLYAFEAGRRALEGHFKRLQIPAEVEHAEFNGLYRTRYRWPQQPLVSVIILNTDNTENLSKCIQSVLWSDYSNYEIILVENASKEQETFAYYEKIIKEQAKIRLVTYRGENNSSRVYNFGETEALGDYLLLINSNIQLMDADCMGELLGYCMREDVGAVGAKILYEDETICHAGIVLGTDGAARYVFRGKSRYAVGYESRIICPQNYTAVASSCMMVRREVYQKAGGMSEEFPDVYGGIDFCLKVREQGLRIVYNPYAEVFYYGDKQKNEEEAKYSDKEAEDFRSRWRHVTEAGDPYYNPNLTSEKLDFSLRR